MMYSLLAAGLCYMTTSYPWDAANDPSRILGQSYVNQLSALPNRGNAGSPWSGSYWPTYKGGIAYRWNSVVPKSFGYHLYSLEELRKLSSEQIKQLSPAEKFDIVSKRYDYPTVRSEWSRTYPGAPIWHGLCHGWAPAAYMYYQPSPVAIKNNDGVVVYFGSSDIKGLLTYFVSTYSSGRSDRLGAVTKTVGRRCNGQGSGCEGVNPGSLHLLLTNLIALRRQVFLIDVDKGSEVWNQPVTAYQYQLNGNTVHADVEYTVETQERWEAHPPVTEKKRFSYTLDLAAPDKKIIGGAYYVGEKVDFAWYMTPPAFGGYFQTLASIYRYSVEGARAGFSRHSIVQSPGAGLNSSAAAAASVLDTQSTAAGDAVWVAAQNQTSGYWVKRAPTEWLSPAQAFADSRVLAAQSGTVAVAEYTSASQIVWLMRPSAASSEQATSSSSSSSSSSANVPENTEREAVKVSLSLQQNSLGAHAMVKVYESHDCDGPLVYTVHQSPATTSATTANTTSASVVIAAPFCIVFEGDVLSSLVRAADESSATQENVQGGFELRYNVV